MGAAAVWLCWAVVAAAAAAPARAAPVVTNASQGSCLLTACLMSTIGAANLSSAARIGSGDFTGAHLDGCGPQLAAYISTGAYAKDLEIAAKSAFQLMGLPPAGKAAANRAARRKRMVVFDVDETALSNVLANPADYSKGRKLAERPAAPAIKPVLALYKALCAAGHPVAFVTGRREPKRNATAAALKAAGYGGKCENGTVPAPGGCCYVELKLRAPTDNRLASVSKPDARRALQLKHGVEIWGSIGDQLSDMNGLWAPEVAVKLPNPFYTIL